MPNANPITRSKTTRLAAAQKLIAGTGLHFPDPNQTITFAGATRAISAVTQLLQSLVDLRSGVDAARAASKARVALEKVQSPPLVAVVGQYVTYLRATFGEQPDVLADFGLTPFKARAPQTAEQKAAAAAKRKATRQARHTMGKDQKKAVKGAVSATLVVTPLPGSPSATAPAPSGATTAPTAPPAATTVTPTIASPSTAVVARPATE